MGKINQIGFKRLIRYFIFGLWEIIFRTLPYSPLRIVWLKLGGATIGKNTVIDGLNFTNLDRTGLKGLIIGKDCYLGIGVLLDLADRIILGNQVTLAAKSIILTHHSVGFADHPLIKFYPKKTAPTEVKSGSVIGVNTVIFPGITIGTNSLIGAASLVNNSIPDQVMAAGSPAVVKKRLQ